MEWVEAGAGVTGNDVTLPQTRLLGCVGGRSSIERRPGVHLAPKGNKR
jgi:hypothetical protein